MVRPKGSRTLRVPVRWSSRKKGWVLGVGVGKSSCFTSTQHHHPTPSSCLPPASLQRSAYTSRWRGGALQENCAARPVPLRRGRGGPPVVEEFERGAGEWVRDRAGRRGVRRRRRLLRPRAVRPLTTGAPQLIASSGGSRSPRRARGRRRPRTPSRARATVRPRRSRPARRGLGRATYLSTQRAARSASRARPR